jgi:ABC-type molybdate transport system substrate-binding protein
VAYVAGALEDSSHAGAAAAFIGFLASQAGQDAYAAYGFLPATEAERTLRLVPAN